MNFFNRAIMKPSLHPVLTLIIICILILAAVPGIIGFNNIPLLNQIGFLQDVGGIRQDNTTDGYVGSLDSFYIKDQYVEDTFGDPGTNIFISVESENIFTYETLVYLRDLHQHIASLNGVTDVTSVINLEDVSGQNDEIVTYDLIPKDDDGNPVLPQSQAELTRLKTELESNGMFESFIYSKKRNSQGIPQAWNISIGMEEQTDRDTDFINSVEKELQDFQDPRFTTYLFGGDVLTRAVDNSGVQDLGRQVPLILLVICLIYFLNFNSVSGVVFPVTGNVIAVIWIFGLIGYIGIPLAFIHLLLLPLLIALGSSYAIHLLNQYYREAETYTKENKRYQIGLTIKHIIKTIMLAGATTMVGLLSNTVNQLVHIRTFGLFAALGVFLSVIVAVTYIPALLSLKKVPVRRKKLRFNGGYFDRIVDKLNRFTVSHSRAILITTAVIVVVSAMGTVFVSNDISDTDYFSKNHRIRFLTDYFSENFDGVQTMSVVLDTRPGIDGSAENTIRRRKNPGSVPDSDSNSDSDLQEVSDTSVADTASASDPFGSDPFGTDKNLSEIATSDLGKDSNREGALKLDVLRKVEGLCRYAESLDGVGKALAFTDMVKRFNYIMHNNDPAYDSLPATDQLVTDYTYSFGGEDENFDGLPDSFDSFIDPNYNILKITLKLKNVDGNDFTTGDSERVSSAVSNYIEENFDTSRIYYLIAGGSMGFMTIQNYIINGQVIAIVFSLIIIFILTSILFRSARIGMISIIPMGIAVLINFGVMGIFGIKLDIATALIASFAIGIGIDDTIHYLLNFKKEWKDREEADISTRKMVVYHALNRTSKAIIFTSLALIFGFSVLGFSSFMPIRYFSILVALTMVNATLATLMVLPSVILRFPGVLRGFHKRTEK